MWTAIQLEERGGLVAVANYTYKCRACEEIWDTSHSVHVENPVEELGLSCPECSSDDIFKYLGKQKRLVVTFKGTGWAHLDAEFDRLGVPESVRRNGTSLFK